MLNLLWKEWHEQSWTLGFGCIVLGAFALIGLHSRIIADQTMMMWVCFVGLAMLPALSSTGLIPAERSEGSLESLLAMPIAPWQILATKTVIGMLLCVSPLMVAAVVSLLVAGNREMSNQAVIDLYARSTFTALSLFMWMFALTARLPSEARAGLVAIGLLIIWLLASAGMESSSIPLWISGLSPLAFVFDWAGDSPMLSLSLLLLIQLSIVIFLWAITVTTFKKTV